jgi:hypothetical protein
MTSLATSTPNDVVVLTPSKTTPVSTPWRSTLPNSAGHRQLTQVGLAERLKRAHASVCEMETAADNLLSTVRSVVESIGGRLELVAVLDDERIAIATR